jgi:hypothetical protein
MVVGEVERIVIKSRQFAGGNLNAPNVICETLTGNEGHKDYNLQRVEGILQKVLHNPH